MNKFLTYIFLTVFLLSNEGCQEDDYVYPDVLTEFTEVQTNDEGVLTYLLTDQGDKYQILEREGLDGLTPDSIYRTLCVYQITDVEKETVQLYSAQKVLSMLPKPASAFSDGIRTDPLDIQSIWLSGKYLNMVLLPMAKDKSHIFHFVENSLTQDNEGRAQLELTLYHDQNGDYEAFTRKTYLSIPLWGYGNKLDTGDRIVLHIQTYKEGNTTREFTLP
ncbi:MAG: NigD-like protein [Bacteroides sp.]|nr:NigD-like protein [Bacteroides sp.]